MESNTPISNVPGRVTRARTTAAKAEASEVAAIPRRRSRSQERTGRVGSDDPGTRAVEFEDRVDPRVRGDSLALPQSVLEGMERLSLREGISRSDNSAGFVSVDKPASSYPMESTMILGEGMGRGSVSEEGIRYPASNPSPTRDEDLESALFEISDVAKRGRLLSLIQRERERSKKEGLVKD